MRNVRVAFCLMNSGKSAPVGYQFIQCHGIWDFKLDPFKQKFILVDGGHMIEALVSITYLSLVSRDGVRVALTIAFLLDLEVKADDIMNSYLTAPNSDKTWTVMGPEFVEDAGKKALIVRALYGKKSSGASFRNHILDCLRHLGYTSCKADADIWMKESVRPYDGFR